MIERGSPEWLARLSAYDQQVWDIISEHGLFLQGVFGTEKDPGPNFVYTVGLTLYDHPEIISFLPFVTAQSVLNDMGLHHVKELKERYEPGPNDTIFGNDFPAYLLEVSPEKSDEYLTGARRMFNPISQEPIPALQLVWPDESKKFPWEEGFEDRLREVQPLLGPTP